MSDDNNGHQYQFTCTFTLPNEIDEEMFCLAKVASQYDPETGELVLVYKGIARRAKLN